MLDFQVPRISTESVEENRGSFTIEPLDRGFGYTFGNSLRRVLLSSLAGAAVTSVRIEGVAHEFSTIQGVKEDVTDIVLNLKGIVVRLHSDATEVEAPLVVTGPGEITAKDIDLPSGVEILNPDAHIATLEKNTKLEVYLTLGRGRGYRPAEENKSADQPIGVIPIDSIFSPVRRVAYNVEQARVGQKTDFDKLTLDIETDGSIDPHAALREAAEILISQLAIFTDEDAVIKLREGVSGGGALDQGAVLGGAGAVAGGGAGNAAGGRAPNAMDDILIEELELGVRSYNCLKRAGIQTVGDLVNKTESELNAIPNFGKKSIDEVIETLHTRGLALRDG
ncbi:MAG: DNA-directed RNA polymerase subunit alpha [Solirubrobacterales bacterium]|nr:DNA-directed RNA polymerase subunit alpha [Solirubrobacterales bacterium]